MDLEAREKICRALGITGVAQAHEIILQGVSKGAPYLLQKKLNAKNLAALGYGAEGMRKLGYGAEALSKLGYGAPPQTPDSPKPETSQGACPLRSPHAPLSPELEELPEKDPRRLIAQGVRASELKHEGVTVHHCLGVGIEPRTLLDLGFGLDELARECRPTELRSLGFNARELNRFFSGHELKNIGYSAAEMRGAGFTVRQLLNFGYNPNHIIAAGYSLNELIREGLSTRTSEKPRH